MRSLRYALVGIILTLLAVLAIFIVPRMNNPEKPQPPSPQALACYSALEESTVVAKEQQAKLEKVRLWAETLEWLMDVQRREPLRLKEGTSLPSALITKAQQLRSQDLLNLLMESVSSEDIYEVQTYLRLMEMLAAESISELSGADKTRGETLNNQPLHPSSGLIPLP